MTEFTVPFVGDVVTEGPKPPAPRAAPDDLVPDTTPLVTDVTMPAVPALSPGRHWQRPLVDLLGAVVSVLGVQATGLALEPAAMVLLVTAWPLLLAASGCYSPRPIVEPLRVRFGRVLRGTAVLGLASWVVHPFVGDPAAPASLVPAVAVLGTVCLVTTAFRLPARPAPLVLAGGAADVEHALAELGTSADYDVVAACVSEPAALQGIRVHVGVADAVDVARDLGARAVLFIPGAGLPVSALRRMQWQAPEAGLDVYVGTALLDVDPQRTSVVQGAGLDLLHVRPAPLRGPRRLLKGVFDRTLAVLGLLVALPLLVAIAVAIRLDSPGSPIFKQTRVGRDGKTFTMYKFRTMRESAEADLVTLQEHNEVDDVLFKVRADPRITRLGHQLRKYSVDEVPQLWNVVLGDMSLVGPRPALPREVEQYELDPRRRLAVKPGLTGLWQVSGRSDLSWAESVRLDVKYVDNWSIAHDLSILRRTVNAVLGHRGAY